MNQVDRRSRRTTLAHVLAAGIAAEAVFELFGLLIAPLILGVTLMPSRLVVALVSLLDVSIPDSAGWAGHLLTGIVLFPLGYLLVWRILRYAGWALTGSIYGLGLWFIAQGVLAPLVGRSFMMDFGAYTWASLIGHQAHTLTLAYVFHRLTRQDTPEKS